MYYYYIVYYSCIQRYTSKSFSKERGGPRREVGPIRYRFGEIRMPHDLRDFV